MAYEFQKLSEVSLLTEVPEGASILAEVNGDIKRVPSVGLGGDSGKTLIVTSSDFADTVAGVSAAVTVEEEVTFTTNMTLAEFMPAWIAGEITGCKAYTLFDGVPVMISMDIALASAMYNTFCLILSPCNPNFSCMFFWTEDGISTTEPSQPK